VTGVGARRLAAVALASLVVLAAGCGSSSPSQSSATAPASGSPTSSASAAPATSPSVDPSAAAIRAFVAFAASPKATYQATFTGHQRASVTIITISRGTLQVDGRDVLVRGTFTFPRKDRYVVEHRYVGGKAWIRFSPMPWQRLASFDATDSMGAFAAVHGPADVTYLGPVRVGSRILYKVRIHSAIVNPVMVPAFNLTERAVTGSRFDVLVDAAGHPVSGDAEITGRGRVSGQLQEIAIDLRVTFRKLGDPVTITAP
jgi:hypothetical protein